MYRLYKYKYRYPRPEVTSDCVIFAFDGKRMKVLLIERAIDPFRGNWALPGGFLKMEDDLLGPHDHSAMDCAVRELLEETGLTDIKVRQLKAFSEDDRDPRDWTVTVVYYAMVLMDEIPQVKGDDDAARAMWFNMDDLPDMAFDHRKIINLAIQEIQHRAQYYPVGMDLLPEKFTLSELRALYEAILLKPLDEQKFRRRITSFGHLKELKERGLNIFKRPARLFRFNKEKYERFEKDGLKPNF